MSKNAKQYAQEMLKMSTSAEGKKEVVNACLFVLKTLSDHGSFNPKDVIAGADWWAGTGMNCPASAYCITVGCIQ